MIYKILVRRFAKKNGIEIIGKLKRDKPFEYEENAEELHKKYKRVFADENNNRFYYKDKKYGTKFTAVYRKK